MKKNAVSEKKGKLERFYRIAPIPPREGCLYGGFQPEVLEIVGDEIVSRKLVEKPDLFEYTQTRMVDLMDPREHDL